MKKFLYLAAAICGIPALTSCSGGDITESVEYMAVQTDGYKWGFVSKDGKQALEGEYDNAPSAVVNGYFSVLENDKYVLYKFDEKRPKAVAGCDELDYVGCFNGAYAPVTQKDSRITVIDRDGKKVSELKPIGGHEITECYPYFTDDLLAVCNDEGKMGYVDKDGKAVIALKYSSVTGFTGGVALVATGTYEDMKWMVIDKKGEKVMSLKKDATPIYFQGFDKSYLFATRDGAVGYYDKKGEYKKCPGKVSSVVDANKDCYVFRGENYEYGVLDYDGNSILSAKFNSISLLANGDIIAERDDKVIIYNAAGEEKTRLKGAEKFAYYPNFGIFGYEGSTYSMFDMSGERIKGTEFKVIGNDLSASSTVRSTYADKNSATADELVEVVEEPVEEIVEEVVADSVAVEEPYYY